MLRSRSYTYTLNNYTDQEVADVQKVPCSYHVYGIEVGESGTPHLQGFLYFDTLKSMKQVSLLIPRAHLEKARNNEAAIKYCKKDGLVFEQGTQPIGAIGKKCTQEERARRNKRLRDTSLNELVETGELNIKEVRSLKNARLDLAQESPLYTHDECRGIWYWGEPGTGKSHSARTEYPDAYLKNQNKWFDGYAGQETILLDDFDCKELGHHLKIWADKWSCVGEVKGGQVNLRHKRIIITSNYHPDNLWHEDQQMCEAIKRRFKITRYNKL